MFFVLFVLNFKERFLKERLEWICWGIVWGGYFMGCGRVIR